MTPETETTCYRHPDRPTGLSCSECGRPICTSCSIPAAVGQRCPQCVADQGRQETVQMTQLGGRESAPLTYGFIGVAVAIQLVRFFAPEVWATLADQFALFNSLVLFEGEWYRMFSVVLLHGGLTHILFNMYALYILGPQLERQLGPSRYVALFLSTAAAGSALAILLGDPGDVGVGASGALFGYFGVFAAGAFLNRRTRMGRAQLNVIGLNLLINALIPLYVPQVSWEAHLGGFLGGIVFGLVFFRTRGDENRPLHLAVLAGLAVGSVLSVLIL